MSTVDGVNSTTNTSNSSSSNKSASSTSSNSTLGKDDFLKLLVTQMQNQDPSNPMDDTQSVAEMAQFSALEQMTNIATAMDTLNTNMTNFMQQSALSQGAALIGKTVTGVDTDGKTKIEGTVESVIWTDGAPQLQVLQSDGTTANLDMSLITSVQNPSSSQTDGTSTTGSGTGSTPTN